MVGTEDTRLVVLRGNSASGKSSVAAGLREKFGRGLALVGQDNLRRIVLARHATKQLPGEYGEAEMRGLYREHDLLPGGIETVIGADSTLAATVDRIMLDTGLACLPASDR
ncbi:hypothetical protein [Streptomyces sp. NPDC001816]|uniref:hypothetical protein n=1 Tax=Streptomyces sp. NPDC001816 TaxID=3364612 RepID=UPI0036883689